MPPPFVGARVKLVVRSSHVLPAAEAYENNLSLQASRSTMAVASSKAWRSKVLLAASSIQRPCILILWHVRSVSGCTHTAAVDEASQAGLRCS